MQKRYYPLVEALIKTATGATRVHVFDNTVRKGSIRYAFPGCALPPDQTVFEVHRMLSVIYLLYIACFFAPIAKQLVRDTAVLPAACRAGDDMLKNPSSRAPATRVHVDYTHLSGPERLNAFLPDEAETLRKTPFAVLQVSLSRTCWTSGKAGRSHCCICMLVSTCLCLHEMSCCSHRAQVCMPAPLETLAALC